ADGTGSAGAGPGPSALCGPQSPRTRPGRHTRPGAGSGQALGHRLAEALRMRMHKRIAILVAVSLAAVHGAATLAAEPRVDLEVATEANVIPTEAGKWTEMLSRAGFTSVRIRGRQGNEQPLLESRGTATSPAYHVVGLLTTDNKLLLPKGNFGL